MFCWGTMDHMYPSAQERFDAKTQRDHATGCLLWTAHCARGYGRFKYKGRDWLAHRYAWTAAYGPIPDGYEMDHLCEVKNCVELTHLHLVTRLEHVHQPHSKGIGKIHAARTHCAYGHPFSGDNLYTLPNGWRGCKACKKVQMRRWYLANRAKTGAVT